MNIKSLALLSCVAFGIAAPAFAPAFADAAGGPGGLFKTADTNKDGFVTADELKAFGDKMHAEWAKKHGDQASADTDKDGKKRDFSERILNRVDTDKDGKISKAEFDAAGQKMFAKLDENKDGKIEGNEMPQRHWARFGERMFDRMDTDKDGKVTKAEFQAAGERMFQRMDKNGDGIIEKDEMQKPGEQAPTP